jgi:nicotinamide-nucleotide amidase
MEKLFASIITIGDELLIGQVVDTNSAFIGQELNKIGVTVKAKYAVGDVKEDIWNILDKANKESSIFLITGGLGPTADDITKPLLCEYFGGRMIVHQPTLEYVTYLFEKVFNRPMIERNIKQAEVPDVCTVLKNENGTAPGMMFEKSGKLYFAMPGVPSEMKGIMKEVLQIIQQKFTTPAIEHRTLLTMGMGESFLAEHIKDFETSLPSSIKLAYLPNYGLVRLRLTGHGTDAAQLQEQINSLFATLKQLVKDVLVADEDIPIEAAIGKLLLEKGKTMSTAESCTGGYVAHLITTIPGSSKYYYGSVVSYDYTAKANVLHVQQKTLDKFGAVSEETVKEMAIGALQVLKTDYTIAVSGIMGPAGATDTKPVGLVWMAAASKEEKIQTKQFNFRFDRKRNIEMTGTNAINFLRKFIAEN